MRNIKIEDWSEWKYASVTSSNIDGIARLLHSGEINSIHLSPFHGFNGDLTMLKDLPPYQGVIVQDAHKIDCEAIPRLNDLQLLSLDDGRTQNLDFSAMPNLMDLSIKWVPKDILPRSDGPLKSLCIWHYKPKSRDLSDLPAYENLEELQLVQTRIERLEGLQRFKKLKKISVAYCRALTSVAALVDTAVERVEMEACGQILDIPLLAKCVSLKAIRASGCGTLKSLNFLNESKSIDWFTFVNTNIEDGDMTPLFHLETVGFMNKRHFSHTMEQVEAIISKRHGS